jgi:hypothetical protein
MEQRNRDLLVRLESRERQGMAAARQAGAERMRLLWRGIGERLEAPMRETGRLLVEMRNDWQKLIGRDDVGYPAHEKTMASLFSANEEIKDVASEIAALAKLRAPLAAEADLSRLARAAVSRSRKRGTEVRLTAENGDEGLLVLADPEDVVSALQAFACFLGEKDGGELVDMRVYGLGNDGCVELTPQDDRGWGSGAPWRLDTHDLRLCIARLRVERNGGLVSRTEDGSLQIRIPRPGPRSKAQRISEMSSDPDGP